MKDAAVRANAHHATAAQQGGWHCVDALNYRQLTRWVAIGRQAVVNAWIFKPLFDRRWHRLKQRVQRGGLAGVVLGCVAVQARQGAHWPACQRV